jgi:hypothetical protein
MKTRYSVIYQLYDNRCKKAEKVTESLLQKILIGSPLPTRLAQNILWINLWPVYEALW